MKTTAGHQTYFILKELNKQKLEKQKFIETMKSMTQNIETLTKEAEKKEN